MITTQDANGRDNGCIANTVFQVANDPMRLLLSSQTGNLTRQMIEESGKFNVSVLTESVPFETIRLLGMQSGRDADKLSGLAGIQRSANGLAYLTEHTNALFSCEVQAKLELGSHTIFIGEVKEARVLGKEPSCTYAHYHKAIRPKT